MADRMVWPLSMSRNRKWPRVTKRAHSRVVGLRLEGSLVKSVKFAVWQIKLAHCALVLYCAVKCQMTMILCIRHGYCTKSWVVYIICMYSTHLATADEPGRSSCIWHNARWLTMTGSVHLNVTRNSSGDEIANVNLLYDDILHALKIQDSCINSATDRFLQRRFTKFSEITQCNGHYAVQGHPRSPILVPIKSSHTTSY